jgi:DNA-binding IclR family transcriptional regulator
MPNGAIVELDILRLITGAVEPITAREIVDQAGLPRATVYRILSSLECAGWLESAGTPKRYAPSLRIVEMGMASLRKLPAREELFAGAVRLARETGKTVVLAVYDHGDALFTENVTFFGDRLVTRPLGRRLPPLTNAPGKAMLAHMPDDEVERVIRRGQLKLASETKTSPEELRAEIETTRRLGYGYAVSEGQEGSAGVAMAVFNQAGEVAGAISVATHVPLPHDYPQSALGPLRSAVTQVSMALGYRPHTIEALA